MFQLLLHIRDNYRFVLSAVSHWIGGSWCHVRTEDTQSFLMGNLISPGGIFCLQSFFSIPGNTSIHQYHSSSWKKKIFKHHEEVLGGLGWMGRWTGQNGDIKESRVYSLAMLIMCVLIPVHFFLFLQVLQDKKNCTILVQRWPYWLLSYFLDLLVFL